MYQISKLFRGEGVVAGRDTQIFEIAGIDNHKITFQVVRPLEYLRTTQGDVQQTFLGSFFQHIAVIEYDSYQPLFFIHAYQGTLYQKTDVPLLFIDETVGRQGDDALATFVQFL